MYKVLFTKKAEKQLHKLNKIDGMNVIKRLKTFDFPFLRNFDVKPMTGVSGFYRFRVGQTRIIFEIDKKRKEIWIRKIGYRGGIYRN